jgi:hypothetical protein
MTRKRFVLLSTLVGSLLSLAASGSAHAQSADALIDKLVDKGILSVKEANELREETDKGYTTALQSKLGMPDWVTAFKMNGDLRLRYENFTFDDSDAASRNRFRYRARLGFTAVMKDQFEVGLRLTSSDPSDGGDSSFGGDPISGNTTFQNNGSKKFVYFDTAYGKWTALNTAEWLGSVAIGKMDNPFVYPSTCMFDRDYTPEGAAVELSFRPSMAHTIKFTGAGFALDEVNGTNLNPYTLGGQLRWDAIWNTRIATSLGVSGWYLANEEHLNTSAVPNQGYGNTRTASGNLVYDYTPIQTDGSLTYTLDKFPLYNGAFPITGFGEYIHNPGAPDRNNGYALGVVFGKSGKKGLWDIAYQYRSLEGDVWWEELPESDFGANYIKAAVGGKSGYRYGTNTRGHIFKGQWSPYDALTLTVQYFLTELIDENPKDSKSGAGRLQVDATLKF